MNARQAAAPVAVENLRRIADLMENGLPIPVGITPATFDYPTSVQLVDGEDFEAWRIALDLPEARWTPAAVGKDEFGKTNTTPDGIVLQTIRRVPTQRGAVQ